MILLLFYIAWPPAWALGFTALLHRTGLRSYPPSGAALLAFVWGGVSACDALDALAARNWPRVLASAVNLLIALAIWWWRRKDRRRALRELGAKSRATIASLVRSMRERTVPRPVLIPVPGGAR